MGASTFSPQQTPQNEPLSANEKYAAESKATHHDDVPTADALAEALAEDKIQPLSGPLLKLYCFCFIAFLCSTMNGESANSTQVSVSVY